MEQVMHAVANATIDFGLLGLNSREFLNHQ